MLGLAYIVVTPLWQGHEADYYTVVRFLADNGRLPDETDYPPGEADVRQATQPPLFFVAAVPVVALLDDAQPVPPGTQPGLVCIGAESINSTLITYPMTPAYQFPVSGAILAAYGLRFLNLLFGMLAVAITYKVGRLLFPAHPAIALVGAALLALEPNTLQMMTTLSNDALLLPIAAANLYCAVRMFKGGIVHWRWALAMIGLSALAILTRLSGWAVFGFDILAISGAIVWTLWEARKRAKRGQLRLALVGVALLVIAGAGIAAFNYSQYGTIFGRYRWLDDLVVRAVQNFNLPFATIVGVFDQTRLSYESPFNALMPRRAFLTVYSLLAVVALDGAIIGFAMNLIRRWRQKDASLLGAYGLLIGAVGVAVGLVLFRNTLNVTAGGGVTLYNTATIFAPLRYYNAGLPALALLLSAGLAALVEIIGNGIKADSRTSLQRLVNINPFGIGVALIWGGVALLSVIMMGHERPSIEVTALDRSAGITINTENPIEEEQNPDAPRVLTAIARSHPQAGFVELILPMITSNALTLNYAIQVDMVSEGIVVNSCQFLPARGYMPTIMWDTRTIYKVATTLPNCAGEIDTPLDLRLRWLGADMNGVIQSETEPITLTTVDPPLAQAASCPQTLGIVAGGYRVTRFNSPPSVRMGETYLPSANWIVTEPSPDVIGRLFIFTHTETREQYSCNGADRVASLWVRGEYVYFDRCPMTFPSDAPLGEYTVSVGLVNTASEWMPATDAAGNPLVENVVPIGTVQLEN